MHSTAGILSAHDARYATPHKIAASALEREIENGEQLGKYSSMQDTELVATALTIATNEEVDQSCATPLFH